MTTAGTFDVSALIDSRKVGWYQIRILVLCFVLFLIDGFDTQAIAYVAPAIAREWDVPPKVFGPIFALGLLGSAVGMMALGPFGDRFGRKIALLSSIALSGVATVLTALAATLEELMLLRFVTGIGLGGALPNIMAISSEYAPARTRSSLSTTVFSGFPLGIVLGGIVSAEIIPAYGWGAVFLLGGAVAIAVTPLALFVLPESIRFLVMRKRKSSEIAAIVARIDPRLRDFVADDFVVSEQPVRGKPIADLFTEGRALGTVLIWALYFTSLFWAYFMLNWLPLLLRTAGLAEGTSVIAPALLNMAGIIACVVFGRIIDTRGPFTVMCLAYVAGALFTGLIGYVATSPSLVIGTVFAAGFFGLGAQFSIIALVCAFYGTTHRASGLGWAIGAGRLGSIVGSMYGGMVLNHLSNLTGLFLSAAIAPVLAAMIVLAMRSVGIAKEAVSEGGLGIPSDVTR